MRTTMYHVTRKTDTTHHLMSDYFCEKLSYQLSKPTIHMVKYVANASHVANNLFALFSDLGSCDDDPADLYGVIVDNSEVLESLRVKTNNG